MKLLIALTFLAVSALAKPLNDQVVAVTQDTLGNYKLDLNIAGLSRAEERNADGHVSGTYSYVDPNGVVRSIQYEAGVGGFRAFGDTVPVAPVDVSVPVEYTPEVALARAAHLALLNA